MDVADALGSTVALGWPQCLSSRGKGAVIQEWQPEVDGPQLAWGGDNTE